MDSLKRELNETKKKEKNSEQNVRELQQFIEHFRQQQGKYYYIMIRTIHADFHHLTPKCRQDLKLSGRFEFDSLIIMVSL